MARGQSKPPAPQTLLEATVWLYADGAEEPTPTKCIIGARERIEASRHYDEPIAERFARGDEEAMAYTAWLAMKRWRGYTADFDTFVDQLAEVSVPDDEDDQEADAAGRS